MANEEEKIILQADLYDNRLTEVEGDYTARLRQCPPAHWNGLRLKEVKNRE